MTRPVLVWFRDDLRLADNPALTAALAVGGGVVPVYILDDEAAGGWRLGGAARWWLHHSLVSLGKALGELGHRLLMARGRSEEARGRWLAASDAQAVFWNRRYEPWAVRQDRRIKAALRARGLHARSFNAGLCVEPWQVPMAGTEPYRVFTPYSRAWVQCGWPPPLLAPSPAQAALDFPAATVAELDLLPRRPDWSGGLGECWQPGEVAAWRLLARFLDEAGTAYRRQRHLPGRRGVSRLSPHLRFGEIGPRQVWHATRRPLADTVSGTGVRAFRRQLVWREFAHYLLYHYPDLPERPLRRTFAAFPWRHDPAGFRAWRTGRTGYPIVDAGMRELWRTGYMHNRVRMIAGSFLAKHLLLPWQRGAAWFWDTLCDADLANNSLGWQWVAGTGADGATYFRMLDPVAQGLRFDPDGSYVRRWVPELAGLPGGLAHSPWTAPPLALMAAGLRLGETYPRPIVVHGEARARALDAFGGCKGDDAASVMATQGSR